MFPTIMVSAANALAREGPRLVAETRVKEKGRQRLSQTASLGGVLLLAGSIYGFPWFFTAAAYKSQLPPIFSPDFYAYLSFSRVFKWSGIPHQDPWYGLPIAPQFSHSTFRAAFVLFGELRSLLGSDVLSSVIWTVAWGMFIALGLWLLLRSVLKDASPLVLFAATCMVLFVSLNATTLSAWVHAFSGVSRERPSLPFVRTFFPQIAVPLLMLYLMSCKNAREHNRLRDYIFMSAAQALAFVSFPYASVAMALVTAVFIVLNGKQSELRSRLSRFACVGIASVFLDSAYIWWARAQSSSVMASVSQGGPIFRLDWSHLRLNFGGTVILLFLLACLLLMLRSKESSVTLAAAMGLANALMLLADFAIDSRFLVSHHAGYFVQVSLGLQVCVLLWHIAKHTSPVLLRAAVVGITACCLANGMLASWATVEINKERNASLSAVANVISGLQLKSADLIVAPSTDVDDASTAIPLLSKAHVLYTQEAEMLLSVAQEDQQSERHAIYWFLTGGNSDWLARSIAVNKVPYAALTVGQGFKLQDPSRKSHVAEDVRKTLLPKLVAIEHGMKPAFLPEVDRIVVIDSATKPLFVDSRVKTLLTISNEYQTQNVHVRIGTFR